MHLAAILLPASGENNFQSLRMHLVVLLLPASGENKCSVSVNASGGTFVAGERRKQSLVHLVALVLLASST